MKEPSNDAVWRNVLPLDNDETRHWEDTHALMPQLGKCELTQRCSHERCGKKMNPVNNSQEILNVSPLINLVENCQDTGLCSSFSLLFPLSRGIFSSSVIPAQIVNARLPRFETNMM